MADLYVMDRSEYILKRLVLLRTWEAPTISDVKKNFGNDLAEKICCNCDESFREDFGLEPPLKGPMGKDLWSSPSDLLIGKVCLKPPFTSKYIRALTHQAILEIGLKVEKLFWNQMEIEKSKELEEQERTLKLMCETSKKETITEMRNRLMENFRTERLNLINEMDEMCKEELSKLGDTYHENLQEELKEQAKKLEQYYLGMIDEEKSKNDEVVSNNPSIDREEIESTMQSAFQAHFQKIQIHARFEMQAEHARCREKLKLLRHELECKNLANLMYVMCMERKKSNYENSLLQTQLEQEISNLGTSLKNRNEEIENLLVERDDLKRNLDLRESALSEVIKEFQKFINFSLKAVPKQAEYLLCADKLLVFELASALSKVKLPKKQDDHDRNYLWDRTPSETDSTPESLRVKDGHDCLKEAERVGSELSVGQFLPGFHYNDQLFVREDFRNMVSQGIKIKENDMLWTKRVQDIQDQMELSCHLPFWNESRESTRKYAPEKKKSIISYQSSVHFSLKDKDMPSLVSVDIDKRSRRTSLKNVEPEDVLRTVDFSHVGAEERRKTLLGTRNSVELIKESILNHKSSLRCVNTEKLLGHEEDKELENLSEEKEIQDQENLIIVSKDSIVHTKFKQVLAPVNEMKILKEEEIMDPKRNVSKLISVTDSLEIMKRKPSKVSYKNILHDSSHTRMVTSEEFSLQKLHENNEDNGSLKDPPRRISIVFTGKSVIYDEHENKTKEPKIQKPNQVRGKREKKLPRKIKKRQNAGKSKKVPSIQEQVEMPQATEKIIMGDSKLKFYHQNEEQFSSDRINSFINIIKEHPNLIRLFTSVTR